MLKKMPVHYLRILGHLLMQVLVLCFTEIRTAGIQYLREETNKKPLAPGVVNPYCSLKCLSVQCSLHFFLSKTKVKQSIVYIAIYNLNVFTLSFTSRNFITSSGKKEVAFLEILNDHFFNTIKLYPHSSS